jgi:hypothetical protein
VQRGLIAEQGEGLAGGALEALVGAGQGDELGGRDGLAPGEAHGREAPAAGEGREAGAALLRGDRELGPEEELEGGDQRGALNLIASFDEGQGAEGFFLQVF